MSGPVTGPGTPPPPITLESGVLISEHQAVLDSIATSDQTVSIKKALGAILEAIRNLRIQLHLNNVEAASFSQDYYLQSALAAAALIELIDQAGVVNQKDTDIKNETVDANKQIEPSTENVQQTGNDYNTWLQQHGDELQQARDDYTAAADLVNQIDSNTPDAERTALIQDYNTKAAAYQTLIQQYNQRADAYNAAVGQYNAQVAAYNAKVATINEDIQNRNTDHPAFPKLSELPTLTTLSTVTEFNEIPSNQLGLNTNAMPPTLTIPDPNFAIPDEIPGIVMTQGQIESLARDAFEKLRTAKNKQLPGSSGTISDRTAQYSGELAKLNDAYNKYVQAIDELKAATPEEREAAIENYNTSAQAYNDQREKYLAAANAYNDAAGVLNQQTNTYPADSYNEAVRQYNESVASINQQIALYNDQHPDSTIKLLTPEPLLPTATIPGAIPDDQLNLPTDQPPPSTLNPIPYTQSPAPPSATPLEDQPAPPPSPTLTFEQLLEIAINRQLTALTNSNLFTRDIVNLLINKIQASPGQAITSTSFINWDPTVKVSASGEGVGFGLAALGLGSSDAAGEIARAVLNLVGTLTQKQLENILVLFAVGAAGQGVLTNVKAAEILGIPTLENKPPNNVAGSVAYSVGFSSLVNGQTVGSQLSNAVDSVQRTTGDIAGSAAEAIALLLKLLLILTGTASLGKNIDAPTLVSNTFSTADLVASTPSFGAFFDAIGTQNPSAFIAAGPLNKALHDQLVNLITGQGLVAGEVDQIARTLETTTFSSAGSLGDFLKGHGLTVTPSLTNLYGLSALQPALATVSPTAVSQLGKQITSPGQIEDFLSSQLGAGKANEALTGLKTTFAGTLLAAEFGPKLRETLLQAKTPEDLVNQIEHSFLLTTFGFVPGEVPEANSTLQRFVDLIGEQRKQDLASRLDRREFDDRTTHIHEAVKIFTTGLNEFDVQKLMYPGGIMTLWGNMYRQQHDLAHSVQAETRI